MSDNGGNGFATGLLLGGIIGTVIGILIAPKEGSQTRSELMAQTSNFKTQAEGIAANVRENMGPAIDTAIDNIGPTVQSVRKQIDPLIDQVNARLVNTSNEPDDPEQATTNT